MGVEKNISDIRNHFFDKSELYWRLAFWLAFVAQLLLFLAIWVKNVLFLLAVVASGILLPIAIVWLRELSLNNALRGDKCRRLILYDDGLGRHITREDMLEIQSWVLGFQVSEAPFV